LANNAAITAAGIIGLTWQAPSSDGGSAVIDYRIEYKENGVFREIHTSTTTSYTIGPWAAGFTYTFRVKARNIVNYGPVSNEVSILAASIPT